MHRVVSDPEAALKTMRDLQPSCDYLQAHGTAISNGHGQPIREEG